MAIRKINVDGVEYNIAGTSSAASSGNGIHPILMWKSHDTPHDINREENNRLFIRCEEGAILETDVPVLGRFVTNKKRVNRDTIFRYHGWINPKGRNNLSMELKFFKNDGTYDYWEVKPVNYSTFPEYEKTGIYYYPEGDHFIRDRMTLSKKCGIAISRDGVLISEYMHFCVSNIYEMSGNKKVRVKNSYLARW